MKPTTVIILGCIVVAATVVAASIAQDSVLPPGQQPVITEPFPRSQIITTHIPPQRVAVDLEIVGRKFYVLWNDGNVTTAIPESLRVEGDCPADINGDGKVGVPDMLILQAAWGKECP